MIQVHHFLTAFGSGGPDRLWATPLTCGQPAGTIPIRLVRSSATSDQAVPSVQRSDPGENHRLLVRELRHERQLPAHGLDVVPQCRDEQVAALLEP